MDDAIFIARLDAQIIETPSWAFGNTGTRFKTFAAPGAARSVWEKIEDAAEVHRMTGIAPRVALHIPWDKVDDAATLGRFAAECGIAIGAINPNLFQDEDYRLGSLTHPDARIRDKALAHLHDCVAIMQQTGARDLSLWFADGTNYAGQDDIRARRRRLRAGLQACADILPDDARMLIEYKFFEPAFYYTDLADWGAALLHAQALGPQAQVLVDLGHHAQGANIESIVAILLDEGKLGGFHFNARRYADDDLIVGSTNPLELFLIYAELVAAADDPATEACARGVSYMIDQSFNIEAKIEGMIMSILNCQEAYAKALLIDRAGLAAAQAEGDALGAHRILLDAFRTDVRPRLAAWRRGHNLPEDPLRAHREGDYLRAIKRDRGVIATGGGYGD
ncbi:MULTISPECIES: L-rhamnose isomerase [Acidiphilium]|uniref:L-rhamnose isomerase / sugar isomerase n=1 Tax=Acidiphilium rubrum TaxID=526 RepID=A0A8G2CIT7_ACIRU|nr:MULTISPECIES: L-rhamnose isomerase [Acidiphilium]SIQ36928.1 L-rhamnose isomerase / sugar isomerase [Acidiphilium rubrum]